MSRTPDDAGPSRSRLEQPGSTPAAWPVSRAVRSRWQQVTFEAVLANTSLGLLLGSVPWLGMVEIYPRDAGSFALSCGLIGGSLGLAVGVATGVVLGWVVPVSLPGTREQPDD